MFITVVSNLSHGRAVRNQKDFCGQMFKKIQANKYLNKHVKNKTIFDKKKSIKTVLTRAEGAGRSFSLINKQF